MESLLNNLKPGLCLSVQSYLYVFDLHLNTLASFLQTGTLHLASAL